MTDESKKNVGVGVFNRSELDLSSYDLNSGFQPGDITFQGVHTVPELLALLERDPKIELDARVISIGKQSKQWKYSLLERDSFLKAFKEGDKHFNFREGISPFNGDSFYGSNQANAGFVGDDFVPILGGPFFKQLYAYDYLRAHWSCFWALNHDPIARSLVNITRNFTLGRGYRIDCENELAMGLWSAFEKANDIPAMMAQISVELQTYGEIMLWKLPNAQTKLAQRPYPGQKIPKGAIPRVRLIDPSAIWEIVTWPEDITKVLYYVWVAPTQYQTYTGLSDKPDEKLVPTSKFIFQTIPAEEMMHFKVNCMSNEKRGRSDLFPILGYLKRLRDSVNYQLLALEKQSAWSIDVTIKGDQDDVDRYNAAMQALGTIPNAASEFSHTEAIKREYLDAKGTSHGSSLAFEWALSMACAGYGIPMSYLGTHISGGQTRASALVATEPVTKKFEERQLHYEQILRYMWDFVMEWGGLDNIEMEVTFPELVTVDSTAKLKNLSLAKSEEWFSQERTANIASKELGVTKFDYETEKEKIVEEKKEDEFTTTQVFPLTGMPAAGDKLAQAKPSSAVSGVERKQISDNNG